MNGANFFDTNVLLYLLSEDPAKADQAEKTLSQGGVISVQVLNEFASVASRKLKMPYDEIREILDTVRAICKVESVTLGIHDLALELAERYGYTVYDSVILAAALKTQCATVYSEDMQDGQIIEGQLVIRNPFASIKPQA